MAAKKSTLILLTLGTFAIAVVAPVVPSVAKDMSATTLELSAQASNIDPNANKGQPKGQRRQNIQRGNSQRPQGNVQQNQQFQKRVIRQNKQINVQKNIQVQKKIVVQPNGGGRKYVGQPKAFTPRHNNLVYKFRLRGANQALVSGNTYSVYRSNYRRNYNGRFYTFVALGVLAPLAIGAAVYYPYAYLDVPQNYCAGLTEDGCEMVYSEVETVEGDLVPQCTAYCPWQ